MTLSPSLSCSSPCSTLCYSSGSTQASTTHQPRWSLSSARCAMTSSCRLASLHQVRSTSLTVCNQYSRFCYDRPLTSWTRKGYVHISMLVKSVPCCSRVYYACQLQHSEISTQHCSFLKQQLTMHFLSKQLLGLCRHRAHADGATRGC